MKAASVVRGELIGEPTAKFGITRVEVPVGLADSTGWGCFAFNPSVGANCTAPMKDGLNLKPAITGAGLYDPLYYAAVGWPSLFISDTRLDAYSMRALTVIMSAFFLAATFTLLLRMSRWLVAGSVFFAALTPMVLFLSGSVNPNSLEISAGAALAAGLLYVCLDVRGIRHRFTLPLIAVAGFMLANARGISPLWMAFIGIAVLILTPRARLLALIKMPRVIATLLVMALGVAGACAWLLYSGTLGGMGSFPGAGSTTPFQAFLTMVIDRSADPGVIGIFGWLDTPAPPFVYFVWSALIAIPVLCALVGDRNRAWWAFAFAAATVPFAPAIVQALSVEKSGYIWQGRYTIVAVVYTLLFAAVAMSLRPPIAIAGKVSGRIGIVVGIVVVLGQVDALAATLRRYTPTTNSYPLDFLTNPAWAPPGGSVVWLTLLALSFGVLLTIWLSARQLPAPSYLESMTYELGTTKQSAQLT